MSSLIHLPLPGTLGVDKGAGLDGFLIGKLTGVAASKFYLRNCALTDGKCMIAATGGTAYTDESTPFNEATASDVEVTMAAVGDAAYYGHATKTFARLDVNLTVQGSNVATIEWQYWNGAAYTALADVVDGTTGYEATTGWKSVTFTKPVDWAKNTVNGVNAYWIRSVVTAWTSQTTLAELGQGYIVVSAEDGTYTDDTTDFNDAGASDCALYPAYPAVGDAGFIGHATEKFSALQLVVGTAGVSTLTIGWKYWNGSSWAALTVVDQSLDFEATAGTYMVHFAAPADWALTTALNGPNGSIGYFIKYEVSAFTSMTTVALLTSGLLFPLVTGAEGLEVYVEASRTGLTVTEITFVAMVKSGTTADSVFLIHNLTQGTNVSFTATKALGLTRATGLAFLVNQGDKLAVQQTAEDGTTEFAAAGFFLKAA